jgi:hypothetical protein
LLVTAAIQQRRHTGNNTANTLNQQSFTIVILVIIGMFNDITASLEAHASDGHKAFEMCKELEAALKTLFHKHPKIDDASLSNILQNHEEKLFAALKNTMKLDIAIDIVEVNGGVR